MKCAQCLDDRVARWEQNPDEPSIQRVNTVGLHEAEFMLDGIPLCVQHVGVPLSMKYGRTIVVKP